MIVLLLHKHCKQYLLLCNAIKHQDLGLNITTVHNWNREFKKLFVNDFDKQKNIFTSIRYRPALSNGNICVQTCMEDLLMSSKHSSTLTCFVTFFGTIKIKILI